MHDNVNETLIEKLLDEADAMAGGGRTEEAMAYCLQFLDNAENQDRTDTYPILRKLYEIGIMLLEQKQLNSAMDCFQYIFKKCKQIIESRPSNLNKLRDCSMMSYIIGSQLTSFGLPNEATVYLQYSLDLHQELCRLADSSDRVAARSYLSDSYAAMGDNMASLGQWKKALRYYDECLEELYMVQYESENNIKYSMKIDKINEKIKACQK